MAIYNLAPCFDTGLTQGKIYIIDDGGNTLNIGEVWSANDGFTSASNVCGIVLEENTTGGTPSLTASTQYQNCIDCYQNNGINFQFQDCNSQQTFYIPSFNFTSVPQLGETYDIQYDSRFELGFQGCVFMIGASNFAQIGSFSILAGPFADCPTCQGSLPTTIYEIEKCLTKETFYVELTGTTLNVDDMITFTESTNPFEQFCGTVVGEYNGSIFNPITLVSNLGRVDCNECLSQVSEKRIVENCLTGEQQVVWASSLYDLGGSAYLNIRSEDAGCYKIGELTTSAVTLEIGYLDYGPSTSCEECIQCNSITIIYSSCTVNELTGASTTNQYVEIGEVILHPISGCCEVIGYDFTFSLPTTDEFYSYYTFSSCTECLNNESNYETWNVKDCGDFQGNSIILTVPSGYTSGATFEWNYGNTPWLCVYLHSPFVPDPFSSYQFAISNSNFTSCETCTNNLQFGISVINCRTSQQSFRNLRYTDVITLFYIGYTGTFRATDGECYYFLDFCIYNDEYPLLFVEQAFNNCVDCQSFIPPPLSAGTEYTACVVCCPCEPGGTVRTVTVPHPTWTNQYGRAVVLLDAVQLGGMNGLNS